MKAFANHIFGACGPEVGVKAVESVCREGMRLYFHMQEIEDEDEDDSELTSDVRADENNVDDHGENAPENNVDDHGENYVDDHGENAPENDVEQ